MTEEGGVRVENLRIYLRTEIGNKGDNSSWRW